MICPHSPLAGHPVLFVFVLYSRYFSIMKSVFLFVFFSIWGANLALAQSHTDPWLEKYIRSHASDSLLHILDHPDSFRYQLIYTQINRDRKNQPSFTNYSLHTNDTLYFNPASTVKLPTALLALEKLNRLAIKGLDKSTPMFTDSAYSGQHHFYTDSTAPNGLASVGHYVKKIFLVSDNDAYNRLNEFVGQQALNETLWKKGYTGTRITRRFARLTTEENRHSNPIRFGNNPLLYAQPAAYSTLSFDFSRKLLVGNAHYDSNDSLVKAPMDFTTHNIFTLTDMQAMLQAALFPLSVPAARRFNLTENDYRFLYRCMSEYPSESRHPLYNTTEFFDSYTKFFFFKAQRQKIPPSIRVFNKTGWSYGFLTDIAYLVDFEQKTEFMLTGTIYVNRDGIINDDKYDYETLGYPFFEEIGKLIYEYERTRPRKYQPDLSRFRINYQEE
jgi:hypothetical protein